ncbi:uncharacterized protein [Nicotiana sylvestris]|uniref:uncharacterized protein n=1 Tax=Nicotiana sylvestris TaxID=4096 RepID=UPI00388C47D3
MANMVGQVLESHKITFHEDELPPEGLSHNRALHITKQFEDKFIARVLIDGGSRLNIFPLITLKRLGKDFHEILARSMNVKAFDGFQRATIGEINLCLQMGLTWFDIEFQADTIWGSAEEEALVGLRDLFLEDEDMDYSVIVEEEEEEEGLTIQTVEKGIEVVREVENFENKSKSNLDEAEAINLGDFKTVKETRIRIQLSPAEKEEYTRFLKEYEDIFVWSYDDMTGLRTFIVAYKLPTNPMCPLVKQKLRKFKPDMRLKIKEEVTKQIKDKVIRIWVDEEDVEKTAFITQWGVYCYKIIPFGLKNAGATYMRAMTTIFHDMIHKEIEVYVNEVIVKSKRAVDHITYLRKFFDRLRRYNLKLNPAKCVFKVPVGKLLGFIIIHREIELDPSKVKAIQELPLPKSKKDVMSFLGRLNYISRFIAQTIVICEPIFTMIWKDAKTSWTQDCQKAFDKIKEYLSTPPVLVPPELKDLCYSIYPIRWRFRMCFGTT